MADEFFYGVTLTGEKKTAVWDPTSKDEEDYPERANKLILKQILLGVEAKENEYNVVEVETPTRDSSVKIPIAVLKVGENRMSQSFLEFPEGPITFKLTQGNGPVHIHGHHLMGEFDAADMEDLEEEDLADDVSDNEIHADDSDEPKSKKQKTANNTKAAKNDKNNKNK